MPEVVAIDGDVARAVRPFQHARVQRLLDLEVQALQEGDAVGGERLSLLPAAVALEVDRVVPGGDRVFPRARVERLDSRQVVRQQLRVVAGQHLHVHVEEELALAVVEREELAVELPGQLVEGALSVTAGEELAELRRCGLRHYVGPVLLGSNGLEDRHHVGRLGAGNPLVPAPRRKAGERVDLVPVLVVLVRQRVLAPVVEPRRRPAHRHLLNAAVPRPGRVEELGCRRDRPRLPEPAALAVVRDEERERLSNLLRVGLSDQLFDVIERRPQSLLPIVARPGQSRQAERQRRCRRSILGVEPAESRVPLGFRLSCGGERAPATAARRRRSFCVALQKSGEQLLSANL